MRAEAWGVVECKQARNDGDAMSLEMRRVGDRGMQVGEPRDCYNTISALANNPKPTHPDTRDHPASHVINLQGQRFVVRPRLEERLRPNG